MTFDQIQNKSLDPRVVDKDSSENTPYSLLNHLIQMISAIDFLSVRHLSVWPGLMDAHCYKSPDLHMPGNYLGFKMFLNNMK